MLELIKSGQTPGGCKSKNECESYCEGGNHFEECIAFAEKAGFMNPKEAEMLKKTGGKGPGECQGKQACDAFCNDPANRDTCFKFAEDNGLISPEDLKMAKEGMTRMRAGLESAPPEVKDCLKSELGPNIIEDIQSGKLVPGPEIGDKARSCFERAGGGMNPSEVLKNAPPEVLSCLKEKNIDVEKIKSGKTEFTPETGDAFRICFESMKFIGPNGPMMSGEGGPNGGQGGLAGGPQMNFGEFLRSAPQEILGCLEGALGGDFEKIKSGEAQPTPDMEDKMRKCFEQFRPQGPRMGSPAGFGSQGSGGFPPEAETCLKNALGEESFAKFKQGELKDSQVQEKVKTCFENIGPGGEGNNFKSSGDSNFDESNGPRMMMGPQSNQGRGPNFPEAVSNCLKQNIREDQIQTLIIGGKPSPESEAVIKKCFTENGGSMMPPNGMISPANFKGSGLSGGQFPNNQPPGDFQPPESGQFPGGQPPSGMMPPIGQTPPAGFTPPQGFTPPPGEFQNGTPPPPQSYQSKSSLLGVILGPFLNLITQ